MANPVAVSIPARTGTASAAFLFVAATTTAQSLAWHAGYILIAFNSGAGSHTVTVVNNPRSSRSSNTITAESIAAGAYRVFPRFPPQDSDVLVVTGNHAEVLFAVIKP
jgi:hypothetical protein